MYRIQQWVLILVAIWLLLWNYCAAKEITEIDSLTSKSAGCNYEYAYDMYGAHCAGLKYTKIPNLRGGIEILDFSENRLKKLAYDTLSGYSSIKFLYLSDNHIYMIEENALNSLVYLQTLDLSRNSLRDLPSSIFQLESLRKLYLSGNALTFLDANTANIAKPIRAPLDLLDISDCELEQIPNFGLLPQLLEFNISSNPLTAIDTRIFVQACNLKKVDLTDSLSQIAICDLRPSILWFEENKVIYQLKNFTKLNIRGSQDCPQDISHYRCKKELIQPQIVRTSRWTWLKISGSLAGFLIGFMLLLYIIHVGTVARTKQAAHKNKAPIGDNEKIANVTLINNAA